MDLLASAGAELVFFGLSLGLMQLALRQKKPGGLFSALPLGLLPAALVAFSQFWTLQQPDLPEVKAERAQWADMAGQMVQQQAPGKDQEGDRAVLTHVYRVLYEAKPAAEFCIMMVLLAPLAAYLRRRQARRGMAPDPGPLRRWSVPWGLVWLVLAPAFWLAASRRGWVLAGTWADHLALNVAAVGLLIFLFQGAVIFGAKVSAWGRNPRTRALAVLSLAVLAFSIVFAERMGLFSMFIVMLLVTGLLDPWADLRRLKAVPPPGGA